MTIHKSRNTEDHNFNIIQNCVEKSGCSRLTNNNLLPTDKLDHIDRSAEPNHLNHVGRCVFIGSATECKKSKFEGFVFSPI